MRRAARFSLSSPWRMRQQARQVHYETEEHLMAAPFPVKKKESPLARVALRIQAAYERIRLKHLPANVRAAAAAASSHSIRSETDLANVVEQRVWHSALEGDFENLPGKGKPLKEEGNPHADPAEDLMYRILSKNGFAPEWVELNKEIRSHMERWRRNLKLCWRRKVNELSGNESHRDALWSADLKILEAELKDINKKVLHYNLIVPFGRQVYSYSMEEELQQVQNFR
ncbi:hypothetical protein GOP47_0004526 [Adiantum capillus-veneris]|uniref:DnaJ homologue subfamily C member 28 conserved domain-containing protein n=1 Tax=Adiantum capillus-veneris TaxID=13818 RepID=A0A9D4V816_ADICA|nr:hypothetical protein GOP47_0004526 [Adiantum capillus-veneris]